MASAKNKIKKLRREIRELEKSLPKTKEFYESSISETERDIKNIKELKSILKPLIREYQSKTEELTTLWNKEQDIWSDFKKSNSYLIRLFNKPEIPEELSKKISRKKKESQNLFDKIKSVVKEHKKYFYGWEEKIYKDPSLLIEHLDSELPHYKSKLKREKNYENTENSFTEKKAKIKKKKNEIERLLPQLNEEQRKKAILAAYQDESRNIAGSIKNNLKKHNNCPYCGEEIIGKAEADHIYPVALGGLSTQKNMIYVCKECNRKKDQMTLREFIEKYDLNREKIENNLEKLGKKF